MSSTREIKTDLEGDKHQEDQKGQKGQEGNKMNSNKIDVIKAENRRKNNLEKYDKTSQGCDERDPWFADYVTGSANLLQSR